MRLAGVSGEHGKNTEADIGNWYLHIVKPSFRLRVPIRACCVQETLVSARKHPCACPRRLRVKRIRLHKPTRKQNSQIRSISDLRVIFAPDRGYSDCPQRNSRRPRIQAVRDFAAFLLLCVVVNSFQLPIVVCDCNHPALWLVTL